MKTQYRILAAFIFLFMALPTQVFINLFYASNAKEGLKYGTLILVFIGLSLLIAWLFQKAKINFIPKKQS
jgi:hypothetical protein